MLTSQNEATITIIAWLNVVIITMTTLYIELYVPVVLFIECSLGYCLFL